MCKVSARKETLHEALWWKLVWNTFDFVLLKMMVLVFSIFTRLWFWGVWVGVLIGLVVGGGCTAALELQIILLKFA